MEVKFLQEKENFLAFFFLKNKIKEDTKSVQKEQRVTRREQFQKTNQLHEAEA
jgi:hypothetical protein